MPITLKVLAIPVTAAVVLTGLWVTGALITDDVVNERVAMLSAPVVGDAAPRNVRLRGGRFQSVRHRAGGVATAIRLA